MKIFKAIIISLVTLIFVGLTACTTTAIRTDPQMIAVKHDLDSKNIILERLNDQKVLYRKNDQQKVHIASLTKLMTVYILLNEYKDLSLKVVMTPDVMEKMQEHNSTLSGFKVNEAVTLHDLAYGIVLPSGGDAAIIAANYISGSEQVFVQMMNKYANILGMYNTHFTNATGLDTPNQYSTVSDLRKLLNKALTLPVFKKVFTTLHYTTAAYDLMPEGYEITSSILTHNNDLKLYSGTFLGGKTGYTKQAGLCLASIAKVAGQEYLLITTGATGDYYSKQNNILDAINIYNSLSA